MNVSIGKRFEEFVSGKVETGLYNSASEVIRDGLRMLIERDDQHGARLEAIQAKIAASIEDAKAGRVRSFDESTINDIKKRGRQRLAEQRKTSE